MKARVVQGRGVVVIDVFDDGSFDTEQSSTQPLGARSRSQSGMPWDLCPTSRNFRELR